MRYFTKTFIVFSFLLLVPDLIFACSTCFGDPSAPASQGLNWAIITLLGVTGGVLGGIIRSIIVIGKRTKQYNKMNKI